MEDLPTFTDAREETRQIEVSVRATKRAIRLGSHYCFLRSF